MARIIPVAVFDFVVFGATGDLTLRKLLPSLYLRFRDGQMPEDSAVIGAARTEMDDAAFRARAEEGLRRFLPKETVEDETISRFCARLRYVQIDVTRDGPHWKALGKLLDPERIRVFYLATAPDLYGPICAHLASAKLVDAKARVVLEKPIGHDLPSARAINDEVGRVFSEAATYRIDHYLGKETVQNLLALRFANTIFERLWNTDVIDHVQITVGETVGVEGRGGYYDRSGALRDMVQNHMLQLLCLLAMEPPVSLDADRLRDEKLKVLRALRPMAAHEVAQATVRGQYAAGAIEGKAVASYQDDLGEAAGADPSRTETFVALRAEIQNFRWANVPFYLRTGKRLPQKVSEIVVQYRALPFSIFPTDGAGPVPNQLIIRLQPEEGIRLSMMAKDPGPGGLRLRPTALDINFEQSFGMRFPDAYERLLMDTVRGNATLFMRRDEVEAAWTWIEPILEAWGAQSEVPKLYPAGSWGPSAAVALMARDGRSWHEDLG
ncbi:MAG: glucose-6-phosphate dehydrogenase [Rhodospirillales bacterium]|nr:glucose-6-phosphate dehydrogenase [Rhodospirillales bacterium]